jgi:hypothetical protein
MAFPDPQSGLVISYGYLWHREHRRGQEEGRKDRPCVIVLKTSVAENGDTIVRVAPITHSEPEDGALAIEIPVPVKRHLDLDTERSWVILDEMNEFVWPGFDVRQLRGKPQGYAYGFLPPALFGQLLRKLGMLWKSGKLKRVPRD